MNNDTSRNHLKIPKYNHPEKEDLKKDLNKKTNYSTFSKNFTINETHQCPVCNLTCNFMCQCQYNDMSCSNGHSWFIRRNGEKEIGNPHT